MHPKWPLSAQPKFELESRGEKLILVATSWKTMKIQFAIHCQHSTQMTTKHKFFKIAMSSPIRLYMQLNWQCVWTHLSWQLGACWIDAQLASIACREESISVMAVSVHTTPKTMCKVGTQAFHRDTFTSSKPGSLRGRQRHAAENHAQESSAAWDPPAWASTTAAAHTFTVLTVHMRMPAARGISGWVVHWGARDREFFCHYCQWLAVSWAKWKGWFKL